MTVCPSSKLFCPPVFFLMPCRETHLLVKRVIVIPLSAGTGSLRIHPLKVNGFILIFYFQNCRAVELKLKIVIIIPVFY